MLHAYVVPDLDDIHFDLDFDKAVAALLCLLAEGSTKFDQYKACKLLFLADKRHLVRYGRTITGDRYSALEYGPIPSTIRDEIKRLIEDDAGRLKEFFEVERNYYHPRLRPKQPLNGEVLSKSDIEVIREIATEFGKKSFDELKAITHSMPAYTKVWKPSNWQSSFPMKFADFFEEDEDAIAGVLEEAIENYALKKSFA